MNFSGVYQRDKRNLSQMYNPMHSSVASYWTEALQKSEMKHQFDDELFLNNIHLIPDPLKKNLADTLFTNSLPKSPKKTFQQDQNMAYKDQEVPFKMESSTGTPPRVANQGTALTGISNFISGVFNVFSSVMFRSRSPVNYHDCCDDGRQGSPRIWQTAKTDVQDKNGQADDQKSYNALSNPNVNSDMNFDKATVTNCESKLNQVLQLLSPRQRSSPVWVRKRPKKVFVEPGSVEDTFEDAFSPEDFVSLPDDSYIEYYSPVQYHCEEVCESAAQKTKLNMALVKENTDIVKNVSNKSDLEFKNDDTQMEINLPLVNNNLCKQDNFCLNVNNSKLNKYDEKMEKDQLGNETTLNNEPVVEKMTTMSQNETFLENPSNNQLVSSCEDKLARLKAMLQEKRMKCNKKNDIPDMTQSSPPKTIPTEKKSADKRFKNAKRRCSKRPKSKLKCRIEDDLVFANEVNLGTPPSSENSPMQHTVNFGDYFDEVSGRFRSASIGSEDSFQIVFNDCRKTSRVRTVSDCDSEDSFIIFDDSPESCYMSNDIFCDSDKSDSESGMSDSGCGMSTCKLAHTLTRTFSNLADDSLYVESEDEVDFAKVVPVGEVVEEEERNTGLLLDDRKKLLRKCQPSKKVHFSADPPKVHVLRVWAFAARQARAGHWERFAVDRERFKRRIADVDMAVSWVLKPQHRRRVMFQRFMPWWNQLKRKELAEKKEREAEELREEERRKEADMLEAERSTVDDTNNENEVDLEDEEKNLSLNSPDNDSVEKLQSRTTFTEDKIEFNNNKMLICDEDNGKIPSSVTTQNVKEDSKKIQDLSVVNSNIEIFSS